MLDDEFFDKWMKILLILVGSFITVSIAAMITLIALAIYWSLSF